jgi:outer membrane protein TolC
MMVIMYKAQTGGAKAGSMRHRLMAVSFVVGLFVSAGLAGMGQTTAADGSIATPRPINPAASTTNPSARATQIQNPYLGSVPEEQLTNGPLELDLQQAVDRGLKYNLGLIDSVQADADVRAQRLRALAALLPNISARAQQSFEDISYSEIGIKLPPIPGFAGLPATSGNFAYMDARVAATQAIFNAELRDRYHAQGALEAASQLNTKDARDVVVFAVGAAFFQVIASEARVQTAQAQLASARELDTQVANQFKSEVSPEIDAIRAQVERQTAEQRLINAGNDLEKDKLTLGRITGIPLEQQFTLRGSAEYYPTVAGSEASPTRYDLAGAAATVHAAELTLKAARAQRLPSLSLSADYGGAGTNPGHFNQVYTVSAGVSVPLYTGGRIKADIEEARADLVRSRAEYQDLGGRVKYDVRVAQLDVAASESSVKVAVQNKALAERALSQSQDRYSNGVTNYLEVVQAQEAMAAANENYIQSLFSFNVSKIALARAMGAAETRLHDLFGGN